MCERDSHEKEAFKMTAPSATAKQPVKGSQHLSVKVTEIDSKLFDGVYGPIARRKLSSLLKTMGGGGEMNWTTGSAQRPNCRAASGGVRRVRQRPHCACGSVWLR
jgi:hypothetical protein